MVFARRDGRGDVTAISTKFEGDGWEPVRDDAPEVVLFMGKVQCAQNELSSSDLALARVLEDLIDLLVERSVIRFTDLPEAAQAKLSQRRSTRASLHGLRLLDTDQDVI